MEIKTAVDLVRGTQPHLNEAQLSDFNSRYDELVAQGLKANPPPEPAETTQKKRGPKKQSPPKTFWTDYMTTKMRYWLL